MTFIEVLSILGFMLCLTCTFWLVNIFILAIVIIRK
jgi:hypothetical protein